MPQDAEITWNGEKITRQMLGGAVLGLRLCAELLLERSRQVVPNDEGTLERSGDVSIDPVSLTSAVSYDTPYAVRQHEDSSLHHQNGRTDKYLERPWRASRRDFAAVLAEQIRREMGT